MEQRCGPYVFFSNFDSGNLARVEKNESFNGNPTTTADSEGEKEDVPQEIKVDHSFNVWTAPDAAGTQYQNGNRSWFYFGIRGPLSSHSIRITVMNMNRQSKLYAQGYNAIARFLPLRPNWERLRIKPAYKNNDASMMLTFTCTFPHSCDTAYFAFCYPWSYEETQTQLTQLDQEFSYCSKQLSSVQSPDTIYYYRETICYSLQGRKVDLLTISDFSHLSDPEPRFDMKLFPQCDEIRKERCRSFKNKRVFVLTSRVHPGETPSSFVFNGFLNFILRPNDIRAKRLRQLYVFKMIPLLNPDGVYLGHYRTDSRGVNLNRVYLDPNFDLFPSIYAAKSLLVFHHVNNRVRPNSVVQMANQSRKDILSEEVQDLEEELHEDAECRNDLEDLRESLEESYVHAKSEFKSDQLDSDIRKSASAPLLSPTSQLNNGSLRRSGATMSNISSERQGKLDGKIHFEIGNEGSDDDDADFTPQNGGPTKYASHLSDKALLDIHHSMSGIAFYVDLHGHASKRGCFIYGNHIDDEAMQVDNVTYTKLISLNSQHFDFDGCNFTEKNMYAKDRHDQSSKEGAGRVAIFKAIGIVHSYTLECNYNMGRITNVLSSCSGPGSGRLTPPSSPSYMPVRYTQAHFEDVGKAVAIAALDMVQENPCSRIPTSEFGCLARLKEWVRFKVLAGKADSRVYRNANLKGSQNGLKMRSMSMPTTQQKQQQQQQKPTPKPSISYRLSNQQSKRQQPVKKEPISPTKRTFSFGSNKVTSPYFSKPSISVAGGLSGGSNNDDEMNKEQAITNSEPMSKLASLSSASENDSGGGNKKKHSSPARQQLLTLSKVEPSFPAQPKLTVSQQKPLKNDKAEENGSLKFVNRRPQSRGYNFFSNTHISPSSPQLSNGNITSKSYASTSFYQRQMSADAATRRSVPAVGQSSTSKANKYVSLSLFKEKQILQKAFNYFKEISLRFVYPLSHCYLY